MSELPVVRMPALAGRQHESWSALASFAIGHSLVVDGGQTV
jgi:hypothetical protein